MVMATVSGLSSNASILSEKIAPNPSAGITATNNLR